MGASPTNSLTCLATPSLQYEPSYVMAVMVDSRKTLMAETRSNTWLVRLARVNSVLAKLLHRYNVPQSHSLQLTMPAKAPGKLLDKGCNGLPKGHQVSEAEPNS